MKFSIEEIIQATNAKIIKNSINNEEKTKISTDTRSLECGDFYLPLKGDNFDGENFLQKADKAIGCFITKDSYPDFMKVVLKVNDTKEAYFQLAQFSRKKVNPKVVHITGSSGKTTTKEMVYSVCSSKFKTTKTFSNHNNEIGFSETTLSMDENCEVLIVETGMRGLGEIALVSKYLNPDIGIITNVGSAHIGRLGSLDNIAKAKCEITSNLKETLIANNSERIKKFANFDGEKIYYSISDAKLIEKRPKYSKFEYKNNIYELNTDGNYNIENSLAAIEVGLKLNMTPEEIKRGLLTYKPIEKRWEEEKVNGYTIINDSYNANPDSMKASVEAFLELYKNPVVILGDMGELGDMEVELHRNVGKFLKDKNIKNVIFLTVGDLAAEIGKELAKSGITVKNFKNNKDVSLYILENINIDTTIFLKASRSMKFEEIIENLRRNKTLW